LKTHLSTDAVISHIPIGYPWVLHIDNWIYVLVIITLLP